MRLVKDGFDLDIISDMQKYFPEGDGVLHYPDGRTGDKLMTMSIMDRKYYNRTKYIYFQGYESVCADNEATVVAKILGRYKFVNTMIAQHVHPAYGDAPMDELYTRNEQPILYARDGQILSERRKINFGL
jgi:hypothetical protein